MTNKIHRWPHILKSKVAIKNIFSNVLQSKTDLEVASEMTSIVELLGTEWNLLYLLSLTPGVGVVTLRGELFLLTSLNIKQSILFDRSPSSLH